MVKRRADGDGGAAAADLYGRYADDGGGESPVDDETLRTACVGEAWLLRLEILAIEPLLERDDDGRTAGGDSLDSRLDMRALSLARGQRRVGSVAEPS